MWGLWRVLVAPVSLVLAGCSPFGGGAFVCAADSECAGGGSQGVCEPTGFCSFSDEECSSGRRYGEAAGGGLANTCVGALADSGPSIDAPAPDAPRPPLCDPDDPDLVGCYPFEGDAQDGSSYGNHGVETGITYVQGVDGLAMSGTAGSEIRIAESESLDVHNVTIEMWIHPTSLPSGGSDDRRYGLFDNDGQYGFFLHPGGDLRCTANGALTIPGAVAIGAWRHVACTYDGTTVTVYLDGEPAGANETGGDLGTGVDNGSSIGADTPPGDSFVGHIDSVRVWRIPRTASEVCEAAGRSDC
jgi:hypothetical protein